MSGAKIWTEKEQKFLLDNYSTGKRDYLMFVLDRSWQAIRYKAHKLQITRPNEAEICNFKFFDAWSHDMSYILGFICADGWIYKTKVGIGLAYRDVDHLKKIRNSLAPNKKIYIRNSNLNGKSFKGCSLEIGSKYMCKSLCKRGIVLNKSLVLKFPYVPEQYINHFVRGYFDGDGSIYKINASKYWQIEFAGTYDFLYKLSRHICKHTDIKEKRVRNTNSRIYKITYSTYDSIRLGKWMYENSDMRMERKYNKFQDLLEERNIEQIT